MISDRASLGKQCENGVGRGLNFKQRITLIQEEEILNWSCIFYKKSPDAKTINQRGVNCGKSEDQKTHRTIFLLSFLRVSRGLFAQRPQARSNTRYRTKRRKRLTVNNFSHGAYIIFLCCKDDCWQVHFVTNKQDSAFLLKRNPSNIHLIQSSLAATRTKYVKNNYSLLKVLT